MRELFDAIILGIIQGLTEFLPVSSSGHIELGQAIFNMKDYGDLEQQLSVVLHLATALSTIVVFRKDILHILKGLFQFKNNEEFQFSVKIIISMIPAVVVGLLFEEQLEALFSGQVLLVGFMLLITGALLFLADRAKDTPKGVSYPNALIVGLAQMVAILPGISRSGATISTSVLLGIDRAKAAQFSFLMVVPLILGKVAKDILGGDFAYSSELFVPFLGGFIAAFVTGMYACLWMIALVKQSKLTYFAIYCFIVGVLAIGWQLLLA
jgi:undecaprenyl-diphosphatase